MSSLAEKNNLKALIADLNKDDRVAKFAITFKDTKGHYQTQIFK